MTNERMKGKTNTFRHVYIQREMGGRNGKKIQKWLCKRDRCTPSSSFILPSSDEFLNAMTRVSETILGPKFSSPTCQMLREIGLEHL